jgi:hypothetical protein
LDNGDQFVNLHLNLHTLSSIKLLLGLQHFQVAGPAVEAALDAEVDSERSGSQPGEEERNHRP